MEDERMSFKMEERDGWLKWEWPQGRKLDFDDENSPTALRSLLPQTHPLLFPILIAPNNNGGDTPSPTPITKGTVPLPCTL